MGCQSSTLLGQNLTFSICTHDPGTGVLTDADAVPSYLIYEDETGTAILSGNMAKLDDANTTGFYSELVECSTANGFEEGRSYTIYISAAVGSDAFGECYGFTITTVNTALAATASIQAIVVAALEEYDVSHSSNRSVGTALTVSGLVGAAAVVGPRTPMLVNDLFDEVREALRDPNKNNYPDKIMVGYYNRAVSECWHLMTQIGAEIVMNTGTIVADGVARDYELPSDFRAFVPGMVLPRSPVTATSNYSWGTAMTQVGLLSTSIRGNPTTVATPTAFSVFWSGNSQYIRFNQIPPAGENYDFQYYPEYQRVSVSTIGVTYTPWLGLLDMLLARILEEFCREGLEFITTKRDMWRAKIEGDVVSLLGLRHLNEIQTTPSLWRGFPG
jgi:hypothetical protein